MAGGSKLLKYKELYPNNFIDCGIAEEHALVLIMHERGGVYKFQRLSQWQYLIQGKNISATSSQQAQRRTNSLASGGDQMSADFIYQFHR